jgi:hypothetical protein
MKYHYESLSKESLPHCIKKSQARKQSNQQQRQASNAILLFYEIALFNSKNKTATKSNYNKLKLTNADWTSVYIDLNAEIKLRHHLPQVISPPRPSFP